MVKADSDSTRDKIATNAKAHIPLRAHPFHSQSLEGMPRLACRIHTPANKTKRLTRNTSRTGSFQSINGYHGSRKTKAQRNKLKRSRARTARGRHRTSNTPLGSTTI